MLQKLILLGSTGSIGTQALEIVRRNKDHLNVSVLTANKSWEMLAQQVNEFEPEVAILSDVTFFEAFKAAVSTTKTQLLSGYEAVVDVVTSSDAHTVLNSLVGFSGFQPTVAALSSGKKVALANKESLVVGGNLIMGMEGARNGKLLPVDSEHSALFQCMEGEQIDEVEKMILTASGGPFRNFTLDQMNTITVEQALKHPNWSMGAKITIDSATMMNKGLEIIEAYWLFGLPLEKIEAVIHPQSIIHSMVTFIDGSTKAQLGLPDMMVPIQYALSYPKRWSSAFPRMDWTSKQELTFQPVDEQKFPAVRLAKQALRMGFGAPAVLNAANEVAVDRFLKREIPYIGIAKMVEKSLLQLGDTKATTVDALIELDRETRAYSQTLSIT